MKRGRVKDLFGLRFYKLVVVERAGSNKYRNATWLCKCDCGRSTIVAGGKLTSGDTRSCGCLQVETRRKHDMSRSRPYSIWRNMIQRCTNKATEHYASYGGRGISVCDAWIRSFEQFWADMCQGYKDGKTLDRVNVDGNYEPSNCRWVTQLDQMNNTRVNHILTVNGESMTISQWAKLTGISYITLLARVRRGWSPDKAVKTQVTHSRKRRISNG